MSSSSSESIMSSSTSSGVLLPRGMTYYSDFRDYTTVANPVLGSPTQMQYSGFLKEDWTQEDVEFEKFGYGLSKRRNNRGVIFCKDASALFDMEFGYVEIVLELPYAIVDGIYAPLRNDNLDINEYILWGTNVGQYDNSQPGFYAALTPRGIEFTVRTSEGYFTLVDTVTNADANTNILFQFYWDVDGMYNVDATMAFRLNNENLQLGNPPISSESIGDLNFYVIDTPFRYSNLECVIKRLVTYRSIPDFISGEWQSSSSTSSSSSSSSSLGLSSASSETTSSSESTVSYFEGSTSMSSIESDDDPCNITIQRVGYDEPYSKTFDISSYETFVLQTRFKTYYLKDQLIVKEDGVTVYNSGCVSTGNAFLVNYVEISGSASTLTIEVLPNCEGTVGTKWVLETLCYDIASSSSSSSSNLSSSSSSSSSSSLGPLPVACPKIGFLDTYTINVGTVTWLPSGWPQVPFSQGVDRGGLTTACFWFTREVIVGPCLRFYDIELVPGSHWEARIEGRVNYGGGPVRVWYVWARKYGGPTPEGAYTVVASVQVSGDCGTTQAPDIGNITVTV